MENNKILRFWIQSSMRDFHVTLGVLAVASFMVGNLSGDGKFHMIADLITLFAILHFFVHGYFHRQQQFLSNNQRTYSMPKKKIARTGGLYMAGFMVAVGVGITVVKELYTGTLMAKLKAMIIWLLATIFGAAIDTGGLDADDTVTNKDFSILDAMNQVAAKEDSPWDSIINMVQTILIIAGVILLIVLIVMVIVNYVRKFMGGVNIKVDGKVVKGVSDREESLAGQKKTREKLFDFSPNAKMRKLYKKTINRQRRRGQTVPEWMTPAEIETMVAFTGEEKHLEFHQLYEKARYSELGCTDEDAQRAKALKV